ncbi:MAG: hypothetical protein GY835_05645 [bacterium]|nr:hypothetical protein [bacterium]
MSKRNRTGRENMGFYPPAPSKPSESDGARLSNLIEDSDRNAAHPICENCVYWGIEHELFELCYREPKAIERAGVSPACRHLRRSDPGNMVRAVIQGLNDEAGGRMESYTTDCILCAADTLKEVFFPEEDPEEKGES